MWWLIILVCALVTDTAFASSINLFSSDRITARDVQKPEKDWFESGLFYQIYPRSFRDSDGDGVGDINGITASLDHLKDLGVTGTWMSPIFKSPMRDFGYDIQDFYNVDEIFGTNEDLVVLFAKAKQLDIKIILDFVPNHSSDLCEWFIKSEQRLDGYDDWYVWRDAKGVDENGEPIPPSNWVSIWSRLVALNRQVYVRRFPLTNSKACFTVRPGLGVRSASSSTCTSSINRNPTSISGIRLLLRR